MQATDPVVLRRLNEGPGFGVFALRFDHARPESACPSASFVC